MLKLFRYLKNYKKESIIGPLFKLIEACFELAVPLVMANIIDVGIKNQDKPYIYKMGGVLVLLAFCGLACALTAQYFAAKASLGFGTALRRDLFKHINSLSYAEIDSVGSHTLVTRMTADINTAQQGVNILLRLFLRSPFIVLGSIIMAFSISVKLTLIFLIIAPCLAYVIVNFAIIAIIWFGGKTVYTGFISQGEVIALVNYMNQILLALLAMAILVTNITKMQASAIRINDVFAVEPSVSDKDNKPVATDGNAPCVEFRNCFFSYASAEADSLSDISFKAMKGETIGIIGGTGSGKTSLINLIPRFYDVRQGEVLVDGVDVKEYPFSQLRGMIGIVPQKAVLFKGTIRHNMQWRDKNATDEDIWNALDIAQAKDFVEKKPDKLDEMILQEGKNLSGGQRQRLTIARALVGDPEILILDDSASALDLATDARLRKAIHEKTSGMTVFIVSQRISSIKSADKIIVLDDGRIAGIGTHSELYNGCEVYKEICLSQLSEKEAQANG